MSTKLFSCALLAFALSLFVVAAPTGGPPAPSVHDQTPTSAVDKYSWRPLLHNTDDQLTGGHRWTRVEPIPIVNGKRDLDDVIKFEVEIVEGVKHVKQVSHATYVRDPSPESAAKCGERSGQFPVTRRFVHREDGIVYGTWAVTDHFNSEGRLPYPPTGGVIEIKGGSGGLFVRSVPPRSNQFVMARTCESGIPVNGGPAALPFPLVRQLRFEPSPA